MRFSLSPNVIILWTQCCPVRSFLTITISGHSVNLEGGIAVDATYWLLEKMLFTSHSWKLILKPSCTTLINFFSFFSSGENGDQQCHQRARAPPCLISTLLFLFSCKILEPRMLFIAFARLQCLVLSPQLSICLPLAPWWQHPHHLQKGWLWNDVAVLKEIDDSQNTGPMGVVKHPRFWDRGRI